MKVKISKDITKYKERVLIGLTLRQLLSVIVMLVVNGLIYYFLKKKLGSSMTGWIIMIISTPLVLIGFIEQQGMPFEKYLLVVMQSFISPPIRPYVVEDEIGEDIKNAKLIKKTK